MNLLTVLASGKTGLREEVLSVLVGWLLAPEMDHGLGIRLFRELIRSLVIKEGFGELGALLESLGTSLRSNPFDDSSLRFRLELELAYGNPSGEKGFIDIVLACGDWYVLIENKIRHESKTANQVREQYEGFRKLLKEKQLEQRKILSLYLVPAIKTGEGWEKSSSFEDETKDIAQDGDIVTTIYWQAVSPEHTTSISDAVSSLILSADSGRDAPISWDTRQLLLSLSNFSNTEFSGYAYERIAAKVSSERLRLEEIFALSEPMYVGVKNGMGGFITQAWRDKAILKRDYNVSTTPNGWQYVSIDDLRKLYDWAVEGRHDAIASIQWSGKPFFTDLLYLIAKSQGDNIFIGIRGGRNAIAQLSEAEIRERKGWELSKTKKSAQWMSGNEFVEELEKKGIVYTRPT